MTKDLFAVAGALAILWNLLKRLVPEFGEWRAHELTAWCGATRQTQKRLLLVWRLHWQTYRTLKA